MKRRYGLTVRPGTTCMDLAEYRFQFVSVRVEGYAKWFGSRIFELPNGFLQVCHFPSSKLSFKFRFRHS